MKEKMILFIKGIILGIAFIIPGVSGGSLAVLLGIYENLLDAISNFYKSINNFKKYFMYLLPIGLGALVSLLVFARIIKLGLESAPIITILVFLGLILGGIPKLFKEVNVKINFKHLSLMLIGIIIVLLMLIIDKKSTNVSLTNLDMIGYIKLFFVGILASSTMVIPGISGSFTLMLIGYYEPILDVINNITSMNNLGSNIVVLIPFLLGVIIGIVLIAKIINYLLKKYRTSTYFVIIGFVMASVISILFEVFKNELNVMHLVIGIILLVLSTLLIFKVSDKID